MYTITDVKTKILSRMGSFDLETMSLMDISLYVDILRRVSDINEKPYLETLMETMKHGFNNCSTEKTNAETGYALGLAGGAL